MFSHFHSTYSASYTEITVDLIRTKKNPNKTFRTKVDYCFATFVKPWEQSAPVWTQKIWSFASFAFPHGLFQEQSGTLQTGKVYFNSPLHVSSCGVSSSSSCLACGLAGDCSPGLKAVAGDCSCRTPGSDHWGPWRVSSCAGALPGSLCHPGGLIPCSSTKEAAEDKADEGHLSHFPILMCHEQHWGLNFAHTEHLTMEFTKVDAAASGTAQSSFDMWCSVSMTIPKVWTYSISGLFSVALRLQLWIPKCEVALLIVWWLFIALWESWILRLLEMKGQMNLNHK